MIAQICAACGRGADDGVEECAGCGGPTKPNERYRLRQMLSHHGSRVTYVADDELRGERVVIKELMLRATESLKEVELFQREAEVLAQLDHPRIPELTDHFEVRRGKSISLYSVQEFIVGESLASETSTRRFTRPEVATILADVCDLLAYLSTCKPPVVHRDIKPANLLRRKASGEIVLVDFGAARVVAQSLHKSGSTITGTFGYMAPEQLLGQAIPASDVFGLGATALRLLTGREPQELWGEGHRFDYDRVALGSELAGVIDAMTAPDPQDRPTDTKLLALQLRAFVGNERGALERYASRALVTTTGNSDLRRPRRREAWRGFGGDMKLFLLGLVVSVLLASYAGASVGKAPFAAMVAVLGSVLWLLWAMLKRFRRAQLYTTGRSVRGVVTARHVTQQTFSIDYRYQVDGVAHVATEKVIRDTFVRIEEGDEIAVWYNPRHPAVATLSVIADQRGQLPV